MAVEIGAPAHEWLLANPGADVMIDIVAGYVEYGEGQRHERDEGPALEQELRPLGACPAAIIGGLCIFGVALYIAHIPGIQSTEKQTART